MISPPTKRSPQEIAASLLNADNSGRQKEAKDTPKALSKKEAQKKTAQPKPQQYYDVRVEALVPSILTYRILADDPQQAAELIKGKQPNQVQPQLARRKELIAKVYPSGSSLLQHTKKLGN
jgi:hypothetical protein